MRWDDHNTLEPRCKEKENAIKAGWWIKHIGLGLEPGV